MFQTRIIHYIACDQCKIVGLDITNINDGCGLIEDEDVEKFITEMSWEFVNSDTHLCAVCATLGNKPIGNFEIVCGELDNESKTT